MRTDVLILLPAHNEAPRIKSVITGIIKQGFENILVVDDGSTDKTAAIARQAKSWVLSYPSNLGKGHALRMGFRCARDKKVPITVTMDADGQHDPRDIPLLIAAVSSGYDVVLGNRFGYPNTIPFYARVANILGNILNFFFAHLWVADSQCGMRAYSIGALKKMTLYSTRYEIDTEIIREIKRRLLRFTEIPVRVRYTRYSQHKPMRQSLLRAFGTLWRLIRIYSV